MPGKLTRKAEDNKASNIDDPADSQGPGKLTRKAEEGKASTKKIWLIARRRASSRKAEEVLPPTPTIWPNARRRTSSPARPRK